MSQKHEFTKAESDLGTKNSRLGRKAWIRFEKKLAQMNLEKETISKFLELAKVVIAQPGGVFLIGWLTIDGLDRLGYFGTQTPGSPGSTNAPSQTSKAGPVQEYLNILTKGLTQGAGAAVGELFGAITGQTSGGSNPFSNIPGSQIDAAFLKAGLFAICLTQAAGGGQGISTLATAGLAALK